MNINEILAKYDGTSPGGCDSCNAEQKLRSIGNGVWRLTTIHDDWCPVFASMRNKGQRL